MRHLGDLTKAVLSWSKDRLELEFELGSLYSIAFFYKQVSSTEQSMECDSCVQLFLLSSKYHTVARLSSL